MNPINRALSLLLPALADAGCMHDIEIRLSPIDFRLVALNTTGRAYHDEDETLTCVGPVQTARLLPDPRLGPKVHMPLVSTGWDADGREVSE